MRPDAARLPSGPLWSHEIKFDGYRLIARRSPGGVRLWSRHGTNHTPHFTRIAQAMDALLVRSVVLDGEAVAFRSDGLCDFNAIRTKDGGRSAFMVVFDILDVDGEDL